MKLLIKACLCSIFFLLGNSVLAQNDFFFGHHMFNPGYFNPAWIGTEGEAFLAFHHRTQWAGYDATIDPGGAPTTQMASLSAPVNAGITGAGFYFINDLQGPLSSMQARLGISMQRDFGLGKVSFGLMPAINMISARDDYLRFNDFDDELIEKLQDVGSQTRPNLHAGVLYESRKDYFVGASVENLLEPSFAVGSVFQRNYQFFGGAERSLSRNILLRPYLLARTDLIRYSIEASAILEYREKMWGGLSFRSSESMTVLLGYSFLEDTKLKMGYSFDYIIGNRQAKQNTSHEIFLRYNLPNLVFGGRKAVKTPRFSF